MAQIIQLRHTTNAASTPDSADGVTAHLLIGEPAFTIAAAATKFWVGDAAANRLLFSTDPADTTLLGGQFLKLIGGAVTGAVTTNQTTFADNAFVTKDYVDQAVASGQLFVGAWDVAGNDPDLTAVSPTHGQYWIASTGGTAPPALPGIGGQQINPGDMIVWNEGNSEFERIPGGGMTQGEADTRYLRLAGGTMEVGSVITMGTGYVPVSNLEVATKGYADGLVTNMLTAVTATSPLTGNGTSATPLALGVVPISLGGTGEETAPEALDALSGSTGTAAGKLTRSTAGAWSLDAAVYLTGNETIALTGDATGSGTTSIATTLATVNSNVGTFNGLTVNAKGLVTAASDMEYLTENDTITLSGDVTGSGRDAITATLATVNSNVGTFQGITVNAKGLVTAATNMNYLASVEVDGTSIIGDGTSGDPLEVSHVDGGTF